VALCVTLVLAAALVLVWVRVVRTLTEEIHPQPPIGQPRAIVWNDRVFTTDRQLKRYLEAKGASYTRWVSKHPSAFAVIQHRLPASATASHVAARPAAKPKAKAAPKAKPAPKARSKPAAKAAARTAAAHRPAARRALAEAPGARSSGITSTTLLVAALVVLETLLAVVALLPAHLAPEALRRFYVVPERRVGVAAAAITILFGLLVSLYLG
jgi:hypothetical protein